MKLNTKTQTYSMGIGTEEFLTIVYGENPPGDLVLWTRQNKDSIWNSANDRKTIAATAKRLSRTKDVYFSIGLQDRRAAEAEWRRRNPDHQGPINTRGYASTVIAIPGVWIDIDIKGPAHTASNLPPTLEDALALLEEFPLQPTLIVDTGHGVHAYWLFKELFAINNEADRDRAQALVQRFQEFIGSMAEKRGWKVDSTADLARVLRLPGTFNRKTELVVPVRVIEYHEGNRYDPADLERHLPHKPGGNNPGSQVGAREGVDEPGFPPAQIEPIVEGCAWMRHCRDDAELLPEPEWYAMLSILGRCENGEQLAHEWSRPYPDYSPEETQNKLKHALEAAGPRSCLNIQSIGGERYCRECPNRGKITSPIVLGTAFSKKGNSQSHKSSDEQESRQRTGRESQANRLVELVLEKGIQLFHNDVQEPYARVPVKDHWEILPTKGKSFKGWASSIFWKNERQALSTEALNSALSVIEAMASFEGPKYELYNRVASYDGALWYDLADERWRAVRIDADGWRIIENPPILFRRYSHQQPQVEPIAGGDVKILLDFVNLTDEDQRMLLLVYLVTSFVPDIPHPAPVVYGPQGSAKTTFLRTLKRLIDPSKLEVFSLPKDIESLIQILAHHWVAYFDNLTDVPGWVSDVLCRAVTGCWYRGRLSANFRDRMSLLGLNGGNATDEFGKG